MLELGGEVGVSDVHCSGTDIGQARRGTAAGGGELPMYAWLNFRRADWMQHPVHDDASTYRLGGLPESWLPRADMTVVEPEARCAPSGARRGFLWH